MIRSLVRLRSSEINAAKSMMSQTQLSDSDFLALAGINAGSSGIIDAADLDDLSNVGFVCESEGEWRLTDKGRSALKARLRRLSKPLLQTV